MIKASIAEPAPTTKSTCGNSPTNPPSGPDLTGKALCAKALRLEPTVMTPLLVHPYDEAFEGLRDAADAFEGKHGTTASLSRRSRQRCRTGGAQELRERLPDASDRRELIGEDRREKRFALSKRRPLFAFAGLWTPWRGVRGPESAPVDGEHELFGFLTTEANAIVAPIHPKAMPVILTTPEEVDRWLEADTAEALPLQRPLADDALRIVAKGEREDGAVAELALPLT